jgi:hypothetical protein
MLSRPSSRSVDFGEVLKRARPSGNEAKRPSCSAKYRLRAYTHPIRLLQGSSAASRNLARFSTTYLSRQTPHHRDPRETLAPKAFTCNAAALFVGHRRSVHRARLPLLLFPPVPSQAICATREQPLARVIGNGAIRPLQCRRLRRVHIHFVIHGKMDLSETERLPA